MAKIILEKEKCIGCGSCQAVCPKYWQLADDGKAKYLGPSELEDKDIGCNQEAVDTCPVQCIHIEK
ncbi:MAG: ferredoxin [Candidatus Nealsonbacteria bacterium CG09_land_8_20_14_0_10_42_14]|uniref:Ferredoxin n=1 Tax=Candidatus Nealsonbacteria bacterium CG09_land_8_20_14_0_10_42_14 TaxID=1974707 RepID=A0A2H0WXA0_9BACT|nr:MAG: ferredoxin [Candidatus Nealsonbacteria bacterium CG09_land_8_20_14_0_10_42_14]